MRAVAQRLGVEAMSLYHYVRSKDEILDALVDLIFAEILDGLEQRLAQQLTR